MKQVKNSLLAGAVIAGAIAAMQPILQVVVMGMAMKILAQIQLRTVQLSGRSLMIKPAMIEVLLGVLMAVLGVQIFLS